ncbi:MAG: hypothetical protein ACI83W_002156 [Marinoscillum sp.]|jgi:hypothetical protein
MIQASRTIGHDVKALALCLNLEENILALECAVRIRTHLCAHIEQGHLKYQQNLEIIDIVIAEHQMHIIGLSPEMRLSNAS